MPDTHKCESMASADAWVELQDGEWLLNINRTATEEDLKKSQYLEMPGETVETVALNVLYCPYCGEKLNGSQMPCTPSFRCMDLFKGWL